MSSDPSLLQRHTGFARRLAFALVGDADLADDLVQDAWVAALEAENAPEHPRSWLATVIRRAASKHERGRRRRRARETGAARPESLPSTAEHVAAMEMHEAVLRCLRELEEPYRRTLLLRFFDDLGPAEIAAWTGDRLETVRTRLRRGLALLRSRLDAKHSGRRGAWVAVLLPLSRPPVTAALPAAAGALPAAAGGLGVVVMSSKITLSAGLVAVAAAGWLFWEVAVASSPERSDPVPVASAETATAGSPAPEMEKVTGRSAVVSDPPVNSKPAPDLAGRIVVLDVDGIAHEQEDGVFVLRDPHHRRPKTEVVVRDGTFALATLEGAALLVDGLVLRNRAAHFEVARHEVPESGRVEWRAHWAQPVDLRVVDAATGIDLDGITVLHDVPHYRGCQHPGHFAADKVLMAGTTSPVRLPPSHGEATYWVRSERHAWARVVVDHRGGGERELRLDANSASLVVRMPAIQPDANLWLRLFPKDNERHNALSQRTEETTAVFEGLLAREYVLRAELGFWSDGPIVVHRREVDLRSGGRHEIEVDVSHELLSSAPVPCAGIVVLPPGYEDLELSWQLRPAGRPPVRRADRAQGTLDRIAGSESTAVRRFDAGSVTPGRYSLIFSSLQWVHEVEIGALGERDLHVRLPEVGELSLRVFDAAGRACDDGDLVWSRGRQGRYGGWAMGQARPDTDLVYRIVAPLGGISVHAWWPLHSKASVSFRIVPGVQEARLDVRRLPSAWVRLMDGETQVPLDWGIDVDVEGPGDGPAPRRRVIENGRALIVGQEPGRYTVRVAGIQGFEPILERVVELRAGEPAEFVIALRRR